MASGDTHGLVMQDDIGSNVENVGVAAQQQIAKVYVPSGLSQPFSKGEYFINDKKLYRATANFSGAPVVGTNCIEVKLGNDVYAHHSLLTNAINETVTNCIAPDEVETSSTASYWHKSGTNFLYARQAIASYTDESQTEYLLLHATSAIYVGDTIDWSSENANCERITLGEQVYGNKALAAEALSYSMNQSVSNGGTETSNTASNNHTKGSYFLRTAEAIMSDYSGKETAYGLMQAISDIQAGDTLISSGTGQNCKRVTVGDELNNIHNDFGTTVAPLFSTSGSYAVGAYVIYDGVLYRCTTAHTGDWDASHFTAVTVGGDIASYLPTMFAPAGFGWGESLAGVTLDSTSDLNSNSTFPKTMTFRFNGASVPQNMPSGVSIASGGFGAGIAISAGSSGTVKLVLMGVCPTSSSSPTIRLFSRWLLASSRTDWKEITLA